MHDFSKLYCQFPNILSCMRLLSIPILFFLIIYNFFYVALIFFIIDIISDVLDGYIARKFDNCSKLGEILDILGDFFFILISIIALTIIEIYPLWVLLIVIIMFLQFLLTSKGGKPLYDPLGKYYGSFLMIIICITLFDFPTTLLPFILLGFISFTVLSISSRILILIIKDKDN